MELLNIMLSRAYEIGILFICKHLCSEIFFMHYLNVLKTTSLKDMICIIWKSYSIKRGKFLDPNTTKTKTNESK